MDANVIASVIACGVGIVTCAITTGLILWKGGGQAERVETSVRRIEGIEKKLETLAMIPLIEARVGMLENVVTKTRTDFETALANAAATTRSDFKELRRELKEDVREVRASQHEIGGD